MVEYHFDTARSVGLYEGILKEAIHVLKYRKHVALANPLGKIMADQLPKLLPANQTNQIDVIIPVPIHRSKLLDRGFNQAEELARRVSQLTRVPIETKTLVKIKITPDQVGLPREQRAENLLGAFAVTDITKVAGKKILLVDDVFTTGATLSEAAKVLRANGAYQINSYSLARGM
ncbi:MAG: ComF family protein [Armatimonadota bacterium]